MEFVRDWLLTHEAGPLMQATKRRHLMFLVQSCSFPLAISPAPSFITKKLARPNLAGSVQKQASRGGPSFSFASILLNQDEL
jgi:hypothetical protein